jgi:hypothetical protein
MHHNDKFQFVSHFGDNFYVYVAVKYDDSAVSLDMHFGSVLNTKGKRGKETTRKTEV